MTFNPKGLIVTALGILVLFIALETRSSLFDAAFGIVLWSMVIVGSVVVVAAAMRGRPVPGQTGAVREVRRWLRQR